VRPPPSSRWASDEPPSTPRGSHAGTEDTACLILQRTGAGNGRTGGESLYWQSWGGQERSEGRCIGAWAAIVMNSRIATGLRPETSGPSAEALAGCGQWQSRDRLDRLTRRVLHGRPG
jgi:hypothetical protein